MLTSEAALPRLKQLEERQVETAVELMAWSPKMDILALAMKSGDLQLCRAAGNWQKIWSASPPPTVEGSDESATAAATDLLKFAQVKGILSSDHADR